MSPARRSARASRSHGSTWRRLSLQLAAVEATGQAGEGATRLDLGQLPGVADQHHLRAGLFGQVEEAHQLAGADHARLVDDQDVAVGQPQAAVALGRRPGAGRWCTTGCPTRPRVAGRPGRPGRPRSPSGPIPPRPGGQPPGHRSCQPRPRPGRCRRRGRHGRSRGPWRAAPALRVGRSRSARSRAASVAMPTRSWRRSAADMRTRPSAPSMSRLV